MAKLKKDNTNRLKTAYLKRNIVTLILLAAVAGIVVFYVYLLQQGISKDKANKEAQAQVYSRQLPDYSTMEAVTTAQDKTTVTEGTLDLEDFEKQLVVDNTTFFDSIRDIVGDKIYAGLINGFGTDYFHQSSIYNYEDLNKQIDGMLVQAGLINSLYTTYLLDHPEVREVDGCATGKECDMIKFINKYTSGELKDFLAKAHSQWEGLTVYEESKQEVSDSDIDLFYQDEICNNLDYVDKFDVSFIVLNNDQLMMDPDTLQKAYEGGLIPVTRICNYGDVEGAIPARTALEPIQLYKDIDFYDGDFAKLASNTIQTLFLKNEIDGMKYLGGNELASSSDALANKVKEIAGEAPQEGDINSLGDLDYSKIQNWNIQELSFCNRNENDVLYILWKINRIEHTSDIPTKDELKDKLEHKAKVYAAQKKLSATIYAEEQDMTDEQVEDYISSIYPDYKGHEHTDESTSTQTEDESNSAQVETTQP